MFGSALLCSLIIYARIFDDSIRFDSIRRRLHLTHERARAKPQALCSLRADLRARRSPGAAPALEPSRDWSTDCRWPLFFSSLLSVFNFNSSRILPRATRSVLSGIESLSLSLRVRL